MGDYDCRTQGHHWIDHPEDGRFCFYCDEKYDFVQLYNRIEQLEAALRKIDRSSCLNPHDICNIARKALEGEKWRMT